MLRKKNAGVPRFSFIDGPITANVEGMGIHHAWARTYKDVYQRYKAMRGFDQRYQNGFDCQGLWVEVQVERELNLNSKRDIETYGIGKFSDACRARVDRSARAITKHSIRMGQWMDWEHSYFTYTDLNISHIWHVLKLCQDKGLLYKRHRYRGPFDQERPAARESVPGHRVIAWKDVGEAEGTGMVHIAPGCGAEDFALSKTEKLPVLVPIDEMARYVKGYGWLEGKDARDVAAEIAADLERRGLLFRAEEYTHSYPTCWRCHEEIVFRVDDEWFISMDELRPKMMEA